MENDKKTITLQGIVDGKIVDLMPDTTTDNVYLEDGSNLTDKLAELGSGGSGSSSWDSVTDKPFKTLGDGLSVDENGVLSVVGGSGVTIPTLFNDVITKGLVKTYRSTGNITCEEGHKYLIFIAYLTEPTMAENHNVYVSGADIISDIISNKTGLDGMHIADNVSFIISANQTDVIARLEYEAGYYSAYQYVISFDITGYESEIDMSKMSVVQEGNSTVLTEGYYMIYVGEIGGITDLNVYPQQATYYNSDLATGTAAYNHLVAGKLIFIKSLGGITTFTLNTTVEKNCLYYMEIK